jgi:hypothetical protein
MCEPLDHGTRTKHGHSELSPRNPGGCSSCGAPVVTNHGDRTSSSIQPTLRTEALVCGHALLLHPLRNRRSRDGHAHLTRRFTCRRATALEPVFQLRPRVRYVAQRVGKHWPLKNAARLKHALAARIKESIRLRTSPRYVPSAMFAIHDVPRTLTGKKMELPIRRLLLGHPLEKVASPDAMANPGSLGFFVELARTLNA